MRSTSAVSSLRRSQKLSPSTGAPYRNGFTGSTGRYYSDWWNKQRSRWASGRRGVDARHRRRRRRGTWIQLSGGQGDQTVGLLGGDQEIGAAHGAGDQMLLLHRED